MVVSFFDLKMAARSWPQAKSKKLHGRKMRHFGDQGRFRGITKAESEEAQEHANSSSLALPAFTSIHEARGRCRWAHSHLFSPRL